MSGMKTQPVEYHVHKYKKISLGETPVYRCMAEGCTHYLRPELVQGQRTICWRCGAAVIMTGQMAKQTKPHCRECNSDIVGAAGRARANSVEVISKRGHKSHKDPVGQAQHDVKVQKGPYEI